METRPLLLGHRGARREKSLPENTPAAFDFALASGCDGFEFDVRLTADGEAVICHDPQIRGLNIGQTRARDLRLPLLKDILKRYRKTAFLNLELKVPGLEAITIELLQTFPPTRGLVVSSFLPEVLRGTNTLDATTPLGLLCETDAQLCLWPQMLVEYVIAHHQLLRPDLIRRLKAGNKKVFVWTVNTLAQIKRFAALGVDGIISDHPLRLARVLKTQTNAGDK